MAVRTRQDFFGCTRGINTKQLCPHQPPGLARHRPARAAQQGHRRPERLRPRSRHPPGRHAEGPQDLRDHEPGRRRLSPTRAGARQAQRPARAARNACATSAITSTTPSSSASSTRFKVLADQEEEVTYVDLEALVEQQIHERQRPVYALAFYYSVRFGDHPAQPGRG